MIKANNRFSRILESVSHRNISKGFKKLYLVPGAPIKTPVKEKLNKLLNRRFFGAPGRLLFLFLCLYPSQEQKVVMLKLNSFDHICLKL